MDFLTNPYVIIFIVVAVVVSNIMALKYTANAKFGMKQKTKTDETKTQSDAQDKTDQANKEDDENDKSSFG